MTDYVGWLRELAQKGGKGVVNNLDARCLGRIADDLEVMRSALVSIAGNTCCEGCQEAARVAKSALPPKQPPPSPDFSNVEAS